MALELKKENQELLVVDYSIDGQDFYTIKSICDYVCDRLNTTYEE